MKLFKKFIKNAPILMTITLLTAIAIILLFSIIATIQLLIGYNNTWFVENSISLIILTLFTAIFIIIIMGILMFVDLMFD